MSHTVRNVLFAALCWQASRRWSCSKVAGSAWHSETGVYTELNHIILMTDGKKDHLCTFRACTKHYFMLLLLLCQINSACKKKITCDSISPEMQKLPNLKKLEFNLRTRTSPNLNKSSKEKNPGWDQLELTGNITLQGCPLVDQTLNETLEAQN